VPVILKCPEPLAWDSQRNICNWRRYTKCKTEPTTTATPKVTKHTIPSNTRVLAELKCDHTKCTLPNCRCQSPQVPGELPTSQVPQMVLISFDGPVNQANHEFFTETFDARLNPNRCPAKVSFFVSDHGNDYQLTQKLHRKGHEIAVRSLAPDQTHGYWKNISYLDLVKDVIGLKLKLTLNGINHVTGYRAPFHQSAGDTTFAALQEYGFEYDSSLPIRSKEKQWWPFTMDSGIHSFDCLSPPCPKYSYPGLWELPLTSLSDGEESCRTYQSCTNYVQTSDGFYDFLMKNFFLLYQGNKAPLTLAGTASWLMSPSHPYRRQGFMKFLNHIGSFKDVYVVSGSQALDWIRSPVSSEKKIADRLKSWSC